MSVMAVRKGETADMTESLYSQTVGVDVSADAVPTLVFSVESDMISTKTVDYESG